MAVWYAARTMRGSTKLAIAAALLAVLLVAAVPVALFAAVIMMLLGNIAGGLALAGVSILAAAAAVVIANLSGARQLRKAVTQVTEMTQRDDRVVQLDRSDYYYDD